MSHASLQGCRQYTFQLHGDLNVRRGKHVFYVVVLLFSSLLFSPPEPYDFRTQRGLHREKLAAAAGSLGFRVWLVSGNLIQTWAVDKMSAWFPPSQNIPRG